MATYACIASFHTNPYTCGVARFNGALATELGSKVLSLVSAAALDSGTILLSIKLEEIDDAGKLQIETIVNNSSIVFDLFLHATDDSKLESHLLKAARKVFAASAEIGAKIQVRRPDAVSLFAPGAPVTAVLNRSEINLLTFGMAHKISADGFRRLAKILGASKQSFQLEVSSALHEGTSFDENFFLVGAEISHAFGGNVVFLGFLADQEVSRRLQESTALVAFFPKGVRENNTTVMSAMAHGCAVISNLDAASPSWMKHGQTIFDVNQLEVFPDESTIKKVGANAQKAVADFGFDQLAKLIQKI
ncbi:MAG: glycosyltransferase family 1 protein [Actinobacteria bacterium]|nr:glycosyltransferase family 1 protein [Actinomycetota bacterium]